MEGDYVKVQRREKHSMPIDPNNKHWVNDKSKFGYQMLLKMGWSEGKGLGADGQGMTEHIVQNKMVERVGLGATVDTSSNWLENTSAYSQLLSSLKNKFSSPSSEQDASTEKDTEAVKPRCVMFSKRTRAKSIRTKSKQDLAAILGVKPSEVSSDDEIPGSTDSDSETRKEKTKKRKAEIESVEELNIPVEDDQDKKKKKKKKSKRNQETEQEEEPVIPAEEEAEPKKDKKKKKSKKHREEVVQEEAVVEEEPVAELSEKKKKKKSKKHREEAVVVVEEVQAEPEAEVSEKKKKKKKKNRDE